MWSRFQSEQRVDESELPIGVLRIPEQQDAGLSGFDSRPRHIEQWINGLPRADIGEMARLVFNGLHELNRVKVPDSDRFRIAEMFREPVHYLAMTLKKHYIGLPFPLARKKQRVALLARELQAEMAITYKIVIDTRLANGVSRHDNKTLSQSIHRAIYYLSQVLLRCYQIYIPPPHNVWREIHRLYLYAQESGLQDSVIKNQIGEHSFDSTIASLYKQVVLLAQAGPYRLRQSEIETINTMLVDWERHADINEIIDPEQQTGMCSLNLNGDEPPGYLALCSDLNINFCRVLDTAALIEVLGQHIVAGIPVQAPGALGRANKLSVELLRRLVLTWGGMAKRNFSRAAKNSNILVTLGLGALHYFIQDALQHETQNRIPNGNDAKSPGGAAAQPPEPSLNLVPLDSALGDGTVGKHAAPKSRLISKPVFGVTHLVSNKNDPWNPVTRLQASNDEGKPGAAGSGTAQPHYDFHACTTLNESDGGFCLVWLPVEGSNNAGLSALVGELIGMQEIDATNKSRWSVGVVRWMKSRDGKQLELGIQKLAPYAIAAVVRKERGGKTREFQRALVLPEVKTDNQPVTLITPNVYDGRDTLALAIDNDKKTIQLTKVLETTGAFAHFQFKDLKKPERTRSPENEDEPKWNFDNIWPSL